MSRCEDYPCCGHGVDQYGNPDCPDSKGQFSCVGCGKKLKKDSESSFCSQCSRKKVWRREDGSEDYYEREL